MARRPRPTRSVETAAPDRDGTLRIQKYPNRRLYDRTTSRHLTHEELYGLVAAGRRVEVSESRTGADITNLVLAQVLLEHDPGKLAAFPTELFHLLVRVNQRMVPTLQQSLLQAMAQAMQGWQRWQDRVASLLPSATVPFPIGASPLEWMLAAMRSGGAGAGAPGSPPALDHAAPASTAPAPVDELRSEVERLRGELAEVRAANGSKRSPRRSRASHRR